MNKKSPKADKVTDLILRTAWSNRKIAEKVGCTASYVWGVRKKMQDESAARAVEAFDVQEKPVLELTEEVKTSGVDAILNQRGQTYGTFRDGAALMQWMKSCLRSADGWDSLAPDQREALDMIVHKVGRILNGDPDYADSWIDIAGYATLVADRLEGKVR